MSQTQKPSEKVDVTTSDNATATATIAAPVGGQTNYVTSVSGGFDATKSGKTLILKVGAVEVARWLVYDSFALSFPNPIRINGAANLVLEASGTGGNNGTAVITGYTG